MIRVTLFILFAIAFCTTMMLLVPGNPENEPVVPDMDSEKQESGFSGAKAALDFWTRSRAYPDPDIPQGKYYQAVQQAAQQSVKDAKAAQRALPSTAPWQSLGPLNVWGRMLCVALNPRNPNTVLAGSASGGLWRSHTGGLGGDWSRVSLGFPALGIASIAIDSVDTNLIYIGTGEVYNYRNTHHGVAIRPTRGSYGLGILKSKNGGATWTKSLDWTMNQERGVQTIRINPRNSRTVIAGTTDGIFRTTDAGITWQLVLDVTMVDDIVYHPADTTFMLASCGNFGSPGGGIYLSVDGGESWYPMNNLPPYTGKIHLATVAHSPDVVYASAADDETGEGALWRSDNFGASWDSVRVYRCPPFMPNCGNTMFGVQGWYSHFVAAHPTEANILIHAGVQLTKTSDGGVTFLPGAGSHADHHGYAHHPTNPDILYVATDGGIFITDSFGNLFQNASQGLQTTQFYNGFGTSATDADFARGHVQDNSAFRYNGTSSWPSSGADEVGWTVIDPTNDNIVYATLRQGSAVVKSTNRGGSFSGFPAFTGFGAWNSPLVISPSNPSVLYFGQDRIYKTANAAGSWQQTSNILDGNPSISMAISATNPDTVFVGTAPVFVRSHVFRTTNGGGSWQDVSSTLPDRYPMDIAVDPTDSRVVYVAFGGFDGGHLFKSMDGGASWTDVSGTLPNVPTTAVVVDPLNPNIVYVGNDITVYVSTNAGTTWYEYSTGLPEAVIVADLVISPPNRTLRVATHGNGVFERPLLSPSVVNTSVSLRNGWNLISLPIDAPDATVAAIYPGAVDGTTYSYSGQYVHNDTLKPGIGYWTKFPGASLQPISGPFVESVTIDVRKGWNLIGSISVALEAIDVGSVNSGMIASDFYTYGNGYSIADTLFPGKAYWVKVNEAGQLLLSSVASAPAHPLRIVHTAELPPSPPDQNVVAINGVASSYELRQNYPNPFNPTTNFDFRIGVSSVVSLKIYDILGKEVATVMTEKLEPGTYSRQWEASGLPTGVYYFTLEAKSVEEKLGVEFEQTRKLVLMK